jgi:hypothetical protein
MKKYFIILIILFDLICLNALQLTRYYHRNYGIIDRSVFVFDQKPVYSLETASDQLIITVNNSSMAAQINDQVLENNPVLSSYEFSNLAADTRITINLNRSAAGLRKYKVEDFLLSGNEYKLVLDIFKYAEPLSDTEISSFIDFYKKVELSKQAGFYEKMLAEWKPPAPEITQPEQEEITVLEKEEAETDSISAVSETEQSRPGINLLERFKEFYNNIPFIYIIIVAALVIILLIIILIICSGKKRPVAQELFQNTEKLGSKSFRIKVIKILREAGWEDNMIAEELGISPEEVKNIPQ